MRYFWDSWKRKTKQEERAIAALKKVKKLIIENLKDEIIAIYVKGSFIRREMNAKSDVDTEKGIAKRRLAMVQLI